MGAFADLLDKAAAATTCQILQTGGQALIGAAAYSIAVPKVSLIAFGAGTAALLASNYGCDWDSEQPPTNGSSSGIAPGQCMETEGCDLQLKRKSPTGSNYLLCKKLISSVQNGTYPNGAIKVTTTWINCDGVEESDDEGQDDLWPIYTEVVNGGTCVGDSSPEPQPEFPPYEYTEPGEDGCTLIVETLGFGKEEDGTGAPIFKISPKSDLRADYGRIGGCNFAPVIYYNPDGPGGGGPGGPTYLPYPEDPDDGGENPWLDYLKRALAGAAGSLVTNAILDFLEPVQPGGTYLLDGVCEDLTDEGGQPQFSTPVVGGKGFTPVISRLDAMQHLLQAHLRYRTPTCRPAPVKGDWRTIHFVSDEKSPNGKSRLRKRFRYRSQSGIELGGLVDHWAGFSFSAGPVIVWHSGSSLGTPQVWAASIDEGKRVIRHAGGEAGIDPDQVGKWRVGGSDNSRYGVSGAMRVDTTGGYYWITARDGSDARPIVARV